MASTATVLPPYVPDRLAWCRRASRAVRVGELTIGGGAPIVVQSMCTTPTQDVAATVAQSIQLAEAGCQLVRITAPGVKDAAALKDIRAGLDAAGFAALPLVADIHFMPKAAMEAVEHVEKVRINPGNFADKKSFAVLEYSDAEYQAELERVAERFAPLARRAKELGRAMRIGVNHGSLSDRIMNRFGDTPEGMVESALEFIRIAEGEGYRDLVVSMKSSNPKVMVQAYRLLTAALAGHGEAYPLHLGVTEAGDGEDGRTKGASGIGALLEDGLGDTIRVSLTEDPVAEIPVAQALAAAYQPPSFAPPTQIRNRPSERIDPYTYQRRVAEIVRLGGPEGVPVGGGQLPRVLAPARIPADDAGHSAPDAAVADDAGFSDYGQRVTARPETAATANYVRAKAGQMVAAGDGDLVLLDLVDEQPAEALATSLHALPGSCLVGIADPGPLGVTRAYRLLAAVDEAHFEADEAREVGSGVRHAICLALPLESDPLRIAASAGGLLIDGIGDAVYLPAAARPVDLAFTLLQAVKARVTRADYVACPSCGRTLFDLMEVTDHIREATKHLDGVTIAIMGCIVNGPGEMADADFGFVGSGPGKITLYRGKEPVARNIPFDGARDALIELIKDHGMWKDPS